MTLQQKYQINDFYTAFAMKVWIARMSSLCRTVGTIQRQNSDPKIAAVYKSFVIYSHHLPELALWIPTLFAANYHQSYSNLWHRLVDCYRRSVWYLLLLWFLCWLLAYGLTEASPGTHSHTDGDLKYHTVGVAMQNTQYKVVCTTNTYIKHRL